MPHACKLLQVTALLAIILLSGCALLGGNRAGLKQGDRIVFFGDSITQGGVSPTGYVTLVADSLARRYPGKGIEVIGAGISGNKVSDLLARVDRDVIARKPTVTVIYIGINDVWHWKLPKHKGTTPEDFDSGLRTLIGRLENAGSRVILCTPSVIGEKRADANAQDADLNRYADISRKVARETGSGLCDLREAFTAYLARNNPQNVEKGILTTDGVHLNNAGNQFVADRMIVALTR